MLGQPIEELGNKWTVDMSKRLYVCMAPPRSGLTPLTGCLRLLGVKPPEHHIDAGTIDQLLFQDLDHLPLTAAPMPENWLRSDAGRTAGERIKGLLRKIAESKKSTFIFDPLLCRVLPLWQAYLTQAEVDPVFVLMIRHPFEAAHSLAKAENLDPAQAKLVWLAYARAAQGALAGKFFHLVTYDQLLADPIAALQAVLSSTLPSFPVNSVSLIDFIQPSRRHHNTHDLNDREGEDFTAYDGFYQNWRASQYKPREASRIVDLYSMIDSVLAATGQTGRPGAGSAGESGTPFDKSVRVSVVSGDYDAAVGKAETIPLTSGQWQRVFFDPGKPGSTGLSRLQLVLSNTPGLVSISPLKFINQQTKEKLHFRNAISDLSEIAYSSGAIRLPDGENCLFLVTDDSVEIRIPFPKELPEGAAQGVVYIKVNEDEASISEKLRSACAPAFRPSLRNLYAQHIGKISDKWEFYITQYDNVLGRFRENPVDLLEIGVQNGGSLEIWGKYFPNATNIIGCEIDPRCARLEFADPRISMVIGDANDDGVKKKIHDISSHFDLIIDDGSHFTSDIVKSFAKYFPLVKDKGLYIIEDLHASYWNEYGGGLLYAFSAVQFLKLLIDILHQEHWKINRNSFQPLEDFFDEYDCEMDPAELEKIHSVSFMNSLCILEKRSSEGNALGRRVLSGELEEITSNMKESHHFETSEEAFSEMSDDGRRAGKQQNLEP
jgi:hypothetical protein